MNPRADRLARYRAALTADQQSESVVQLIRDLLHAERNHPARRQLERQWDSVQAITRARNSRAAPDTSMRIALVMT